MIICYKWLLMGQSNKANSAKYIVKFRENSVSVYHKKINIAEYKYKKKFKDGNYLFGLENNNYLYIGTTIYTFKTSAEIIEFNGTTATDAKDNVYFLYFGIIIQAKDPYEYLCKNIVYHFEQHHTIYCDGKMVTYCIADITEKSTFSPKNNYIHHGRKIDETEYLNIIERYFKSLGILLIEKTPLH